MAKTKNETRQTIRRNPNNPESHLDSGYEGDDTSNELLIPSCGIEDVDVSLFNLFDKDIGFTNKDIVSANKKVAIKKPFVIFATGERFALSKRLRAPRDKNRKLMLPAISIRRTSITQTNEDITGRGINQYTGTLTIKRKLDESDRDYQNIINKIGLQNANLTTTQRNTGSESKTMEIEKGALLTPLLNDNMWEMITIPQPQYFTSTYEITFWTNYTQHMNYLIETYISSFLPQSRAHKLATDKGYWFVAYSDDNFSNQENFDDFTEDKRVVRYSFKITVKGFLLATNLRRWVSSPNINFESFPADNPVLKEHVKKIKDDPTAFTLSDIDRDPTTKQSETTDEKYFSEKRIFDRRKKKYVTKTVGMLESNKKKGESVFYASSLDSFEEFIKSIK
jgi:hypothetical protein